MNLLVTAGNTLVAIDKVRCITNIFTGRTGAAIAVQACARGHNVTLLTSHPEVIERIRDDDASFAERWSLTRYDTFENLQELMRSRIVEGGFDCVIHCAAVSDYLSAGVYASSTGTTFHEEDGRWEGRPPTLSDRRASKVKSDEPELWLRLVRAPKLIDRIRSDWAFRGLLVKFKLEVEVSDELLLEIAEKSRCHSSADLMAANTLEGASAYAFLGPIEGTYQRVSRRELPARMLDTLEHLHAARPHG